MICVYTFDLDGTIINSASDIASSVNEALKKFGYWTLDEKQIQAFIGDGARKLILRSLNASTKNHFSLENEYNKRKLDEVLKAYMDYYDSNPVVKTKLYAGIKELLKVLRQKNKKIVLLTNKPESTTRIILKKLQIFDYFDLIICPETTDEKGNALNLKPSPEGLNFALRELNRKFQQDYTCKNFIMIGDSAVDIQAGKNFGCKTVGCRGGMGDKEKMLSEKPDLCFSVASEIEKFIDILSEENSDSLVKDYAMKNEVPIMQDEGSDFICSYIKNHAVKKILEIGTAIGYSSVKFAEISLEIKVTTIEIDEERYKAAKKNVEDKNLSGRINLIFGDALVTELNEQFDLIFIDAAKAQYQKFFEKYKKNLSEKGVIICDNLSFHGMVEDLSLTNNYSTKKLVKKIRKFIEFLKTNDEFETEFLKKGDGISLSRFKSTQKI